MRTETELLWPVADAEADIRDWVHRRARRLRRRVLAVRATPVAAAVLTIAAVAGTLGGGSPRAVHVMDRSVTTSPTSAERTGSGAGGALGTTGSAAGQPSAGPSRPDARADGPSAYPRIGPVGPLPVVDPAPSSPDHLVADPAGDAIPAGGGVDLVSGDLGFRPGRLTFRYGLVDTSAMPDNAVYAFSFVYLMERFTTEVERSAGGRMSVYLRTPYTRPACQGCTFTVDAGAHELVVTVPVDEWNQAKDDAASHAAPGDWSAAAPFAKGSTVSSITMTAATAGGGVKVGPAEVGSDRQVDPANPPVDRDTAAPPAGTTWTAD